MDFPGQALRHPRLARANETMGTRGTRGTKFFWLLESRFLVVVGGEEPAGAEFWHLNQSWRPNRKSCRLDRKALAKRHLSWMSTRRQPLTPELQWRLWRGA